MEARRRQSVEEDFFSGIGGDLADEHRPGCSRFCWLYLSSGASVQTGMPPEKELQCEQLQLLDIIAGIHLDVN